MPLTRSPTGFWSAFWSLVQPYWVSEGRGRGVVLLAAVVGFTLGAVWLEVQFNDWNRGFYDTFENKDRLGFSLELGRFTLLALMYILFGVYKQYLQQMLMIEWRAWLTENYMADWLAGQAYYRMQLLERSTDNPDQRIADDLNIFVDLTLSLSLGRFSFDTTLGVVTELQTLMQRNHIIPANQLLLEHRRFDPSPQHRHRPRMPVVTRFAVLERIPPHKA